MTVGEVWATVVAVEPHLVRYQRDGHPQERKGFNGPRPHDLKVGDRVQVISGEHGPQELRRSGETAANPRPPHAPRPGPPSRRATPAPRPAPPAASKPSGTKPEPQDAADPAAGDYQKFLNPYVMLPSPGRNRQHPAWGDHAPPGHHGLAPNLYRGTVTVAVTAESPLLLLDQSQAALGQPLPVRTGPDGKTPLLDPTALKGMLRSAFEAVSVSRYGVFAGHDTPLTTRVPVWSAGKGRSTVRVPFEKSPAQLLDEALRPPTKISDFSPAERLFGWVGGSGARSGRGVAAYRGHVWVEDVVTCSAEIDDLTRLRLGNEDEVSAAGLSHSGLRLATLNEPKPAQYRFYLKDENGEPLPDGRKKSVDSGYVTGQTVPRKFYWPAVDDHLPDDYWEPSGLRAQIATVEDAQGRKSRQLQGYVPNVAGDRYREYLAPPGTKPKVSRSVAGWVKRRARFTFTLRFDGVEGEPLGLLLWLLQCPDLRFGLGGGKPLGFGTVTLDIVEGNIQRGDRVRHCLQQWGRPPDTVRTDDLIQAAVRSIDATYAGHREAFMALSAPPKMPVHYPRLKQLDGSTPPRAESYEWFVQNDLQNQRELPAAGPDPGLPYLKRPPKGKGQAKQGGGNK